ncbi:hypothetical protein K8089_14245 [Aequorivita sp. F47161]|uniref:Uncharacterized protein n=1 Tax=Aequorivita vitellina TaxID=2874475 RepID=A0A9X1UB03_9FLAO|nr:hypothetical protein [Aequorivita vitellina]MCG2420186.1 hypothetical protein [Aequorivita vitellina]
MKKLSVLFGILLVACLSTSISEGQNNKGHKEYVCHIPPGNPENMHTIHVSVNAVRAHLAHGCWVGFCE